MARELMYFTFDEAGKAGPYDERPMLPSEVDLQIHLSRNDRPQPFHLICQHDTVLVVMSGEGRVEYRDTNVLHHGYGMGDILYVPAGTPHRVVPLSETIINRYKLPESELEGVAWYCVSCGTEIHRDVWAIAEELPQEGYTRACAAFNADAALRKCAACGTVHPALDLAAFNWHGVAADLRAAAGEE